MLKSRRLASRLLEELAREVLLEKFPTYSLTAALEDRNSTAIERGARATEYNQHTPAVRECWSKTVWPSYDQGRLGCAKAVMY